MTHVKNLVTIKEKKAVTSSLQVSNTFEKNHGHVLRGIESLKKDVSNFGSMFVESTHIDSYGRQQRMYIINRDGFTLLAMGFTGKKALQFKIEYINAFNLMEEHIKNQMESNDNCMMMYRDKCNLIEEIIPFMREMNKTIEKERSLREKYEAKIKQIKALI